MTSKKPTQRGLWVMVIVLFITSTYFAFNGYTNERDKKDDAQATAVDERQGKQAVVSEAETLAQQATAACAEASGKTLATLQGAGLCRQANKTKDTIEKATNDDLPTPVVTGPNQAQVNAAVRAFLAHLNLVGASGPAGESGPAPTPDQVSAAIASYCSTRDDCRGLQGATGASGSNGSDGASGKDGASGPVGPKGDTGSAGADGSNGSDGAAGRGITALMCSGTFAPITFTVTYTDGTTQDFTCGELAPDPAPSE